MFDTKLYLYNEDDVLVYIADTFADADDYIHTYPEETFTYTVKVAE
jgi:hypothetical protein